MAVENQSRPKHTQRLSLSRQSDTTELLPPCCGVTSRQRLISVGRWGTSYSLIARNSEQRDSREA